MRTAIDRHWSDYYDNGRDFMPATASEISRFLEHLPVLRKGRGFDTALDIGCGTGQLGRELHHRGYRVLGVDASSSGIAFAQEATVAPADKLRYMRYDVERDGLRRSLPLAPYNLITCRYVYAFIKDKTRLLQDVSRVLIRDGVFVLISPLIDHVPREKKGIAINAEQTRAALEEFFTVAYYEHAGDGYFVCRRRYLVR